MNVAVVNPSTSLFKVDFSIIDQWREIFGFHFLNQGLEKDSQDCK